MMSWPLLLAIIAAGPASLQETRRSESPSLVVRASASIDADEIRLSGEILLTLTVEGPTPLDVNRPKPLLAEAGLWRVREEGLPLRELLPNQRQRWTLGYRLSPLIPGDSINVSLNPLTVRAGTPDDVQIAWANSLSIRVTTKITQPSVDDLRPVTDIESAPIIETTIVDHFRWWLFAGPAFSSVLIVLVMWRRSRPVSKAEVHDADWVERELKVALSPDALVQTLKLFLGHRFSQSFEPDTTAEIVGKLRQLTDYPADAVGPVESFLLACDAERFSGESQPSEQLREKMREIVRQFDSAQASR